MQKIIFISSILGALAMASAPFFIDTTFGKLLAIIGLFLLTIQAFDLKAWNLVLLNLTGIMGYFYALYL